MSKTWKWFLGIMAVLVLISVMFAIGYMGQTRMAYGWDGPRGFDRGWQHPMMRDAWNHPMMSVRGFIPFGGLFMLGGLVRVVLFFGLLYGAYWLGRRNAHFILDSKPAAPLDASANVPADSQSPPSGQ